MGLSHGRPLVRQLNLHQRDDVSRAREAVAKKKEMVGGRWLTVVMLLTMAWASDSRVLRAQAAPLTPVTPQNMDLAKDGPFPAYRIIGNVYFVGSKNLCSFLIKTDDGLILINSGYEQTVPLVQASIESWVSGCRTSRFSCPATPILTTLAATRE
jgi:hypothetical protein